MIKYPEEVWFFSRFSCLDISGSFSLLLTALSMLLQEWHCRRSLIIHSPVMQAMLTNNHHLPFGFNCLRCQMEEAGQCWIIEQKCLHEQTCRGGWKNGGWCHPYRIIWLFDMMYVDVSWSIILYQLPSAGLPWPQFSFVLWAIHFISCCWGWGHIRSIRSLTYRNAIVFVVQCKKTFT